MRSLYYDRLRRLLALALCLTLCLGGLSVAQAAAQKPLGITFSVTTWQNRARELLKGLNALRKESGLSPLEMTADLESAALQRAAELFVLFDHIRPDLTDFDSIAQAYPSLQGSLASAECIAAGYSKADEALKDWKSNASSSLLDGDFTHAGVACISVKGSYNEYYWALLLQRQPASFKGRAAAETVKAGKTKTMTVTLHPDSYARADESHKRFELKASDLSLKTAQTAKASVFLYDRYEVKIGKCDPATLRYQSGNPKVFTVAADGTVTRKKAGTGTLTVTADGLSSIQLTVTVGSGTSTGQNGTAVTAATISERKPELAIKTYAKSDQLSVYVRGASGYVLYRCATRNGSYSKYTEKASTSRWNYSLEEAKKTWYYKVRAYKNSNGKRVYSLYSDPVKVEP